MARVFLGQRRTSSATAAVPEPGSAICAPETGAAVFDIARCDVVAGKPEMGEQDGI